MTKSKKYLGVFLNELKNGDISYFITYKDNGEKYRQKIGLKSQGITEKYCSQKRNDILTLIRNGELPEKRKKKDIIVFDDVANLYFEKLESKPKTIREIKSKYNNHLLPTFEGINIFTITTDDIEKIKLSKSKNYAPKTVNTIIQLFTTIFRFGIDKNLYNIPNPATSVKLLSVDNKRERFLEKYEIDELYETVLYSDLLLLFCKLSLTTGARLNSILELKKKDINISQKTISIFDFKNNSTYTGFISPDLEVLLIDKIKQLKPNDFIISENDKQMTDRQIQSRLKPILDRLFNEGLDPYDTKNRVVIHSLRHTFASHLAISGVPMNTIRNLMNHSDIKMTMRYAKLAPDSGKIEVINLYK